MRSGIVKEGNVCRKTVAAPLSIFFCIQSHLNDLKAEFEQLGISIPPTAVSYTDFQIVFEQQWVYAPICLNPEQLIPVFLRCKYCKFGIDSNPHNFLVADDGTIYMVDLFPFLYKNDIILKAQFDYSVDEVYQRYFQPVNVISTYIIRLFLIDYELALLAIWLSKIFLIDHFDQILPRELLRLLACLELENISERRAFYNQSKSLATIDNSKKVTLLERLHKLRSVK